jgi:hypothetical protein
MGEAVKKSIQFFFTSFRRKPESSVFKVLRTYWTPVFTGVTAENQFFHTFGEGEGGGESGMHPPPLYPLLRGEGIFQKSEKKILRLKGVRIYA